MFGGKPLSITDLRGKIIQVGLRDGSLPCGGCQRFESAYLQPVIRVDGIVHTSMEESLSAGKGKRCTSIHDQFPMNVDKISASHVVVRWSGAAFNNEVQTTKGLRWIPRHPETKKGVVNDEMLRGAENRHRSGDSRIG